MTAEMAAHHFVQQRGDTTGCPAIIAAQVARARDDAVPMKVIFLVRRLYPRQPAAGLGAGDVGRVVRNRKLRASPDSPARGLGGVASSARPCCQSRPVRQASEAHPDSAARLAIRPSCACSILIQLIKRAHVGLSEGHFAMLAATGHDDGHFLRPVDKRASAFAHRSARPAESQRPHQPAGWCLDRSRRP
jgi:hypothetical protein